MLKLGGVWITLDLRERSNERAMSRDSAPISERSMGGTPTIAGNGFLNADHGQSCLHEYALNRIGRTYGCTTKINQEDIINPSLVSKKL